MEHHRQLTIADRWHLLHTLGAAWEKGLARHHADLQRALTPSEEVHHLTAVLDQKALARVMARSQAEHLRQARRERRLATFTRVPELSAQGWSGASIARMPGIHKKTAVKYAQADHFPRAAERSWVETRSLAAVFTHAMGCRRTHQRFSLPGHSLPRVRGLGNRCTQLPDDAPRGKRPPEATTKLACASFQGEQTPPTHWQFEPSCAPGWFCEDRRRTHRKTSTHAPS